MASFETARASSLALALCESSLALCMCVYVYDRVRVIECMYVHTTATHQCVQKQHLVANKVNTAAVQDDLKLCPLETKSPQIVSSDCVQKTIL